MESNANFMDLPDEIQQVIFSFLDNDDRSRRSIRALNNKWQQRTRYSNFHFFLTRSVDLPFLISLSRYNYPLSVTFSKTIANVDSIVQAVSALTNLISLSLEGEPSLNSWMSLSTLTNMTQLKADNNPSPDLLRYLTNIKQLKLRAYDQVFDLTRLQHLESLSYDNIGEYFTGLNWILHPSRLTSLDISAHVDPNYRLGRVIARCVNLKYLRFNMELLVRDFEYVSKLAALEALIIRQDIKDLDLSHNLKLTLLDVKTTTLPKNIQLLTRLKSLTLEKYLADGTEILAALTALEHVCCSAKLTPQLPSGLTSLKILSNDHIQRTHIQHLTNLKQLQFNFCPAAKDVISSDLIGLTALKVVATNYTIQTFTVLTNLKSLACPYYEYYPWDYLEDCNMPPNLTFLRTTGILPSGWADLAKMTHLQQLRLTEVEASDTEMEHLTALTNLKQIYFGFSYSNPSTTRSCYFLTALGNLQEILYRSFTPELDDFVFLKMTPEERSQVWPYLYKIKDTDLDE